MAQRSVDSLEIGASYSEAVRLEARYGFDQATVAEMFKRMHDCIDPMCRRAKSKDGRKHKVEQGSFVTREGAIILTVCATRIE